MVTYIPTLYIIEVLIGDGEEEIRDTIVISSLEELLEVSKTEIVVIENGKMSIDRDE